MSVGVIVLLAFRRKTEKLFSYRLRARTYDSG